MYQVDPLHHASTFVWIAGNHPFEESEAELLRLAFRPRATDAPAADRNGVFDAAAHVVQRLALSVRTIPRPVPPGAGDMTVWPNDARMACLQHVIRIGYGQPGSAESIQTVEACLKDDFCRPVNDHEAEECHTVLYRLREGR
jgi:hypothetical protein